jgi:iron complex transport system ATP-binding protein
MFARALAVEADVLIADEPVTSLDPYHQLHVMELLAAYGRGGRGVIVVLHDLALAARFCTRLMLMKGGRVLTEGTPDSVLTDRWLADAYAITALRSCYEGEPYVLPWRRTS